MKRKTPTKHIVKSHLRAKHNRKYGQENMLHQVKSYVRGKGSKVQNLSNPTFTQPKGYTVNFTYSDKSKETIKVIATNYHRALDEAFEEKTNKSMPIEIHVIDPSIGEIINWAGSKALKYGKEASKIGLEYGKEATKIGLKYVKEQATDWRAKQLVDQAYSENHAVRAIARMKLKRDYPEVWNVMDISRS